jgi:biopolymer transport protein TolQ
LDSSLFALIRSAGAVAQLVLATLLIASVISWAIIFQRGTALRRASAQNRKFLLLFSKTGNLGELHVKAQKFREGPMVTLFLACQTKVNPKGAVQIPRMERIVKSAIQDEIAHQEQQIHLLATIGNTAPFVGLFGTVWGIMGAFQEIGRQGTANIASVGPGVAEALITTAAGLFVAIPAVIAYNIFVNRLREMEGQMELFGAEILTLMEDQSSALTDPPRGRG